MPICKGRSRYEFQYAYCSLPHCIADWLVIFLFAYTGWTCPIFLTHTIGTCFNWQEQRGRAHFTSQSNQQSSRRAQSAPARSRSLLGRTTTMPRNNTSSGVSAALSGHAGDGNNISVAHGGFTGTDTYRASAHSHPQQTDNNSVGNRTSHTNTTSNTNNTTSTAHSTTNSAVYHQASMAEKIARWAPQVSDYYKSKEKLSLGGASSVQDDSMPQRARSSLRRQFLKANQSYMQGASAAGVVTKSSNSVSSVSASNNAPFATYATYEWSVWRFLSLYI